MGQGRRSGFGIRAWAGLAVVVALLVYVVATGMGSATQYYLTVGQFEAARASYMGQSARVQGALVSSSVKFSPLRRTVWFDLQGNGRTLRVVYPGGDVPYDFAKAEHAIVVGHEVAGGWFRANQVMVQCPSHYAPAQVNSGTGGSSG